MMPERSEAPHRRQGAIWRTIKAVAWSFFGVRKGADYQEDIARLNPLHIILVGIAGCFLFVLSLVALVNWVVALRFTTTSNVQICKSRS